MWFWKLMLGLALVTAATTSGCSTRRDSCTLTGALTGAALVGGGMAGGIIGTECGPRCVEWKIGHGESIHESVQHHVNRTNDMLLYAALPGAAVGAIAGALIGNYYCSGNEELGSETEVSKLLSAK